MFKNSDVEIVSSLVKDNILCSQNLILGQECSELLGKNSG